MEKHNIQPSNVVSQDTANADYSRATYNVTGNNVCVLVEEPSGNIRITHQEFVSSDGTTSRASLHTNSHWTLPHVDDHATHVAGTIGARGIEPNASGFAIDCSLISCRAGLIEFSANYLSDSNTLNFQLSNHSWGGTIGYKITSHNGTYFQYISNWSIFKHIQNQRKTDPEFLLFGKYFITTKMVDESCYYASTVLSIWASGNENNIHFNTIGQVTVDGSGFIDPISTSININKNTLFSTVINERGVREFWHRDEGISYELPTGNYGPTNYDSLLMHQCAKNTLVVGSVADITSENTSHSEGVVSNFSSRGPTDDGRIKPDIVANGESLYSPFSASDTAYGTYSGTSMACPSVTGCAALNLEYYRRKVGKTDARIPSATLKALMLLTAFRNNKPPNYTKGYGVVDVSASLGFLSKWNNSNVNNANYVYLQEHTCHAKANTIEIYPNPALDASVNIMVCWNDHYEFRTNDIATNLFFVDSSHSVITNQLLVSCSNESFTEVYYPWYLNVNNPNDTARNTVHAGMFDSIYGINAPHDNTKLIEFMPTSAGRHTLTVSLSPLLLDVKPNNATGQKYTIAIQNARSLSTIIYFRQNQFGAFSSPYYRFYSDPNYTNELLPCDLKTGKSYDFRYHGGDSGHPFWIGSKKIKGSQLNSGVEITSAPSSRSKTSGILPGENFILNINSDYSHSIGLHYYCTTHNTMVGSFTISGRSAANSYTHGFFRYDSKKRKCVFMLRSF